MIGRDKLVLHRGRLGRRRLEHLDQLLIRLRLCPSRYLRQVRQFRLDDPLEMTAVDADLLEQRPNDPLPLGDEAMQEMDRRHLRVAAAAGQLDGVLHRLLSLDRELVETKRHRAPRVR